MERLELDLTAITPEKPFTYCLNDSVRLMRMQSFVRTYGQPEDIIVANVNGAYKIVKGELLYLAMLKNGETKAMVKNMGDVEVRDYIAAKVFLNVCELRLNYLDIAEAIAPILTTKHDIKRFSNDTCLPIVEVERYKELLSFDWATFEKLTIDTGNVDLFGERIEILDNYVTRKKFGDKHVDKLIKKNDEK